MTRKEKRKPLKGLLMVRVRHASVYYVNPPSGALHSFTRSPSAHASLLYLQDATTSIAILAMGATGVLWACIAAARDFSSSNKDATTAPLTGGTTYGTSNPSLGP